MGKKIPVHFETGDLFRFDLFYSIKISNIIKNNGDRGIVRSEMQKQQREQNTELSSVMTKEQFAKYLEIKREQRRTRGGRGGGPPGGRNGK